jgi:hypothetical protein
MAASTSGRPLLGWTFFTPHKYGARHKKISNIPGRQQRALAGQAVDVAPVAIALFFHD